MTTSLFGSWLLSIPSSVESSFLNLPRPDQVSNNFNRDDGAPLAYDRTFHGGSGSFRCFGAVGDSVRGNLGLAVADIRELYGQLRHQQQQQQRHRHGELQLLCGGVTTLRGLCDGPQSSYQPQTSWCVLCHLGGRRGPCRHLFREHGLAPVPRSDSEVLSSMDGSLVIDIADMVDINLVSENHDEGSALATVQAGARLGWVYAELDRLGGCNFNAGTCPSVGIGGHTFGGGYGMVRRHYGLAADQTTEMRVVLYNGTVVTELANGGNRVPAPARSLSWMAFGYPYPPDISIRVPGPV